MSSSPTPMLKRGHAVLRTGHSVLGVALLKEGKSITAKILWATMSLLL